MLFTDNLQITEVP